MYDPMPVQLKDFFVATTLNRSSIRFERMREPHVVPNNGIPRTHPIRILRVQPNSTINLLHISVHYSDQSKCAAIEFLPTKLVQRPAKKTLARVQGISKP